MFSTNALIYPHLKRHMHEIHTKQMNKVSIKGHTSISSLFSEKKDPVITT